MKYRTAVVVSVVATFIAASTLRAEEQSLTLDAEATTIEFQLGSTLHTVHGTLPATAGSIDFDLDSGSASGQVVMDARLTETGNSSRDKKMHKEVLEVERHPSIVFTVEGIDGTWAESGPSQLTLHGVVAIHGTEHPVQLQATVERNGHQITASCSFPVPFVEWGMKDPSVFILRTEKHVDVTLDVHGTLE